MRKLWKYSPVAMALLATSSFAASPLRMGASDWSVIKQSVLEDNGKAYYLDLSRLAQRPFFSLTHGDPENPLIGYNVNGHWMTNTLGDGEAIASECWNSQLSRWVDPEHPQSSGYEQHAPKFHGNTMTTVYDGTEVPLEITVTPYATASKEWKTLVSKFPQSLKLNKINWPQTVYQVDFNQKGDVICRDQQPYDVSLQGTITELSALNSAIVVASFFPEYAPDKFAAQSEHDFVLNDGQEYQWQIVTTTEGQLLLKLQLIDEEDQEFHEPSYYLLEKRHFVEVQLNRASKTSDHPGLIRLTYPSSFNQVIYRHMSAL